MGHSALGFVLCVFLSLFLAIPPFSSSMACTHKQQKKYDISFHYDNHRLKVSCFHSFPFGPDLSATFPSQHGGSGKESVVIAAPPLQHTAGWLYINVILTRYRDSERNLNIWNFQPKDVITNRIPSKDIMWYVLKQGIWHGTE